MSREISDKVRDKIRKVFPQGDADQIFAELAGYGVEPHEKNPERVQLAILKLCEEEQLASPGRYVKAAKADFRDVLAWAESPHQMRHSPCVAPEKRAELVEKDRQQYAAWLKKS